MRGTAWSERSQAMRTGTESNAAVFAFYSNRMGCIGSIIVSLIGSAILVLVLRSCSG